HLAGGQTELALQRGNFDTLALQTLAGGFHLILKFGETTFEFRYFRTSLFFGRGERGDFRFERTDFVLALKHGGRSRSALATTHDAFRADEFARKRHE